MPRQGRLHLPGGIYHIIQRGIQRQLLFKDNHDRKEFISRLSQGLEKTGHLCYGWVLMPNHFHLLLRAGANSVEKLMRKPAVEGLVNIFSSL